MQEMRGVRSKSGGKDVLVVDGTGWLVLTIGPTSVTLMLDEADFLAAALRASAKRSERAELAGEEDDI